MTKNTSLRSILIASGITFQLAEAQLVIYEPFEQVPGPLGSLPGGVGLNDWTTSGPVEVISPATLDFGTLANSGGAGGHEQQPQHAGQCHSYLRSSGQRPSR